MAGDFYGLTGVFIIQTYPVGGGLIKTDVAYGEQSARAAVAAQRDAVTYTVADGGAEKRYEAELCSVWEIQASNGGKGPLVTGYRRLGEWVFDGLGGVTRSASPRTMIAVSGEFAEQALRDRPAASGPETALG